MAIKINGVEITSNKLNGSNVSSEKLNGTLVYPIMPKLEWFFVDSSSSEPDNYNFMTSEQIYIQGDYEQGISYLNTNYPAGDYYEGFVAVINDSSAQKYFIYVVVGGFEFYEIELEEYNSKGYKLTVTILEGANKEDVMDAFITQHPEYYVQVRFNNYQQFGIRANDGLGYSYWALKVK